MSPLIFFCLCIYLTLDSETVTNNAVLLRNALTVTVSNTDLKEGLKKLYQSARAASDLTPDEQAQVDTFITEIKTNVIFKRYLLKNWFFKLNFVFKD